MSVVQPPDSCPVCGCNLFSRPVYEKRHAVTTLDGQTWHEDVLHWTCQLCGYVVEESRPARMSRNG